MEDRRAQQRPAGNRRRPPARRLALGLPGMFAIGAIAAACGSSGSSTTTTTAGSVATGALVSTTQNSQLGKILVNDRGYTLYHFTSDTKNHSNCTGSCLTIWHPLLMTGSGSPHGGSGVSGLGTITVPSGRQVTYFGELLYVYTGDTGPGQTSGQALQGTWYAVTVKGSGAVTTTTTAGGNTTTTGGGGYGY